VGIKFAEKYFVSLFWLDEVQKGNLAGLFFKESIDYDQEAGNYVTSM
jgi:hypothetical protein